MKKIIHISLLLSIIACGIKNDPVPPTRATDWGKSLKNVEELENKDSEKDETRD